jgi:hypothetical protein
VKAASFFCMNTFGNLLSGMSKQTALWEGRIVAWFSCGAASLVAGKLAIEKYGDRAEVVNCDTLSTEHPDNARVLRDAESWYGRPIKQIRSEKYKDIDEVFEQTGYMSGIAGARCTVEMKKVPRNIYQDVADIHIFGYTADPKEIARAKRFEKQNPELYVEWILIDNGITKADCFQILKDAGIRPSAMYEHFDNANCKGCVKSKSAGYWNRTRIHCPDVFQRRCEQSRRLGVRLVWYKGERIFLDELPPDVGLEIPDDEIECAPMCQVEAA